MFGGHQRGNLGVRQGPLVRTRRCGRGLRKGLATPRVVIAQRLAFGVLPEPGEDRQVLVGGAGVDASLGEGLIAIVGADVPGDSLDRGGYGLGEQPRLQLRRPIRRTSARPTASAPMDELLVLAGASRSSRCRDEA